MIYKAPKSEWTESGRVWVCMRCALKHNLIVVLFSTSDFAGIVVPNLLYLAH